MYTGLLKAGGLFKGWKGGALLASSSCRKAAEQGYKPAKEKLKALQE